jgi:hypothetical protein
MREIIDVLLLIALGMGYLVIYFAKRDEKLFQVIGYFVGIMMIALATFYVIMNFMFETRLFQPKMQSRQIMLRQHRVMPQAIVPQAIVPQRTRK